MVTKKKVGATLLCGTMLLNSFGCDTGSGALSGAAIGGGIGAIIGHRNPLAGAVIGAAAGAVTGAIIGRINEEQKRKLQQDSPQTWQTIEHNDQVASRYQNAPPPPQQAAAYAPSNPSYPANQPYPSQPAQPGQPPAPPAPSPAAPAAAQMTPITVDDIGAMSASGIKPDVIVDEIKKSQARYTQQDIDAVKRANPSIDPSVLSCMKSTNA